MSKPERAPAYRGLSAADWVVISAATWLAANRVDQPDVEDRIRAIARDAMAEANRQHPHVADCIRAIENYELAEGGAQKCRARHTLAEAVQDFAAWRQATAYDAMAIQAQGAAG